PSSHRRSTCRSLQRPFQGGPHVIVCMLQAVQPCLLRLTHQMRLGLLYKGEVIFGVPPLHLLCLTQLFQALPCVLAEGLEHVEARLISSGQWPRGLRFAPFAALLGQCQPATTNHSLSLRSRTTDHCPKQALV